MKEFDYIIIGGGCAGLSLAYELEIHEKLQDKTWSFWKVADHNFNDCIKKSWNSFSIKTPGKSKDIRCDNFPYQSIDLSLIHI